MELVPSAWDFPSDFDPSEDLDELEQLLDESPLSMRLLTQWSLVNSFQDQFPRHPQRVRALRLLRRCMELSPDRYDASSLRQVDHEIAQLLADDDEEA